MTKDLQLSNKDVHLEDMKKALCGVLEQLDHAKMDLEQSKKDNEEIELLKCHLKESEDRVASLQSQIHEYERTILMFEERFNRIESILFKESPIPFVKEIINNHQNNNNTTTPSILSQHQQQQQLSPLKPSNSTTTSSSTTTETTTSTTTTTTTLPPSSPTSSIEQHNSIIVGDEDEEVEREFIKLLNSSSDIDVIGLFEFGTINDKTMVKSQEICISD
ncbi:hypothetical protein DFA_10911 [Cavenderia fasciculata]|uniref:Uncharacterized protein n=1 Tax=Cavenderia fasciculata TaxID=261658 RepID=F4QBR5_CACFS|nr:uncharacterized protein DFA_10911 [Cavenderia fasciculata]EGG14653.1 hypothetical protein DFA_10911 [Cavenderia fasciculata]|eukprot:XP_004351161.1 hypothetical protein DFA_10911 [Cavenderia fasciculata]